MDTVINIPAAGTLPIVQMCFLCIHVGIKIPFVVGADCFKKLFLPQ